MTVLVDERIAGYVLCWEQEGRHLIGYWIGKDFWGKGIATGALKLFIGQLKWRPLFAYVAKHNIGSVRVLEKCGFNLLSNGVFYSELHGREVEELQLVYA